MHRTLGWIAAVLTLAICVQALADDWVKPSARAYTSRNQIYRLTVFPRSVIAEAQPIAARTATCEATLEKLEGNAYRLLWRRSLVNKEAPLSALITDASGVFVTFDNWGAKGHGDDVVAIYAPSGELIRKLALKHLLTDAEIEALPRSISSILWDGPHRLSAKQDYLELAVIVKRSAWSDRYNRYRTIRIRLADGTVAK